MRDVLVSQPITVTLKAGEWFWVLGVLAVLTAERQNRAIDSIYDQVMREAS